MPFDAAVFAYDSLKRLTSANNPESGTVSSTYDNKITYGGEGQRVKKLIAENTRFVYGIAAN
jgi:hypothetical protein